jgi:hypothetical protein
MPLLLVTFEPEKTGQKYPRLLDEIKSYSYTRLSESSYAIITDKSPDVVFEELKKHIGNKDNIYVINLKRPYAAHGPELVTDWLYKELRD